MNKNKMIVLLAFALTLLASQAFADSALGTTVKGFNASNKVTVMGNKNANGDAWTAAASHSAGDKQFVTTSAWGGIGFITVTPGTTLTAPTAPATPTDSTIPSGYTTM